MKPVFSPYTFARVAAMKSKLFRKEDYDKLLKMGYNEALRYLQDSQYRKEIDEFDVSNKGLEVIETALNANLLHQAKKLHRISQDDMQKMVAGYLLRYDMENVKIILRGKYAALATEKIEPLLYPSINFSQGLIKELLASSSADEVLRKLPFIKEHPEQLFAMENLLDNYYLEQLAEFAASLTGAGKVVAELITQEIEMFNVKTILRLKQENLSAAEISKYVKHPSTLTNKILSAANLQEAIHLLNEKKITTLQGDEEDLLAKLEIDLDSYLLHKQSLLLHQDILSVNWILGYLFAKEIETRNLKALIKGKKLGLKEEILERLLVVP